MSTMRDFIRDGEIHWQRNGVSPCGARPRDAYEDTVLGLLGVRRRVERVWDAKPCETCKKARTEHMEAFR